MLSTKCKKMQIAEVRTSPRHQLVIPTAGEMPQRFLEWLSFESVPMLLNICHDDNNFYVEMDASHRQYRDAADFINNK
jgi:hypothetical protein